MMEPVSTWKDWKNATHNHFITYQLQLIPQQCSFIDILFGELSKENLTTVSINQLTSIQNHLSPANAGRLNKSSQKSQPKAFRAHPKINAIPNPDRCDPFRNPSDGM